MPDHTRTGTTRPGATNHDILIAGAGPNGLMLACELALAGCRPLVLERLDGPRTEQRANGLVGQVVRMLDRRGLYQPLAGDSAPPRPAPAYIFAAFPLPLSTLPDSPVYLLMTPQRRVEEVLAARAAELGVEVRRGHEVTGLTQDADAVTVTVAGPDGGYRVRAGYLVGADGGHSTVRGLAGIGFPGVTTDRTISRTAHVSVPAQLIDPAGGGLDIPGYGRIPAFMHHRNERGMVAFAPFPNGAPLLTVVEPTSPAGDDVAQDGNALSIAELRESLHRVLGVDVPVGPPEGPGPHLLRRLTGGNTRLADRYRAGRVLLLGDAAHVHSAIGGPGLNLGLQDAVNLGWKLAAQVRGWAPPALLDSYDTERRAAARRVIMHTQAQMLLVGPGPEVTALRELFGELLAEPRAVARIADLIAGADLRYDMGAEAAPRDTAPQDAGADRGTPTDDAVGRWAPDLVLRTGEAPDAERVRLAELTRDARPLLLDLTEDGGLAAETKGWRDRVRVVTGRAEGSPLSALLLRPDCYVAWASRSPRPGPAERAALRAATTRWFGAPES